MLLFKDPVGPNWSKGYLILLEAIVVVVPSVVIFVVDVFLIVVLIFNTCSSEASEGHLQICLGVVVVGWFAKSFSCKTQLLFC